MARSCNLWKQSMTYPFRTGKALRGGLGLANPAILRGPKTTKPPRGGSSFGHRIAKLENLGAGEGIRTLDPDLGKVVLYH